MKTVRVRALKQHPYDSIPRKVGEIYEVKIDPTAPIDVLRTLIVTGFAEVVDGTLETRVLDSTPADPPEMPKGRYERRDLRARK